MTRPRYPPPAIIEDYDKPKIDKALERQRVYKMTKSLIKGTNPPVKVIKTSSGFEIGDINHGGRRPSLASRGKIWMSKRWVFYSFLDGGMSTIPGLRERFTRAWNEKKNKREVAKYFKISIPSVKRLAKEYGLIKRNDPSHPVNKRLLKVIGLYQYGYSIPRIAKMIDWSDETVRRYLIDHNIKRRTPAGYSEEQIKRQNDIIREMYLEGKSLKKIEEASGLGRHGISIRLRDMGIKRRNKIREQKDYRLFYDHIRIDFLQGLSFREIANNYGLLEDLVKYHLQNRIFNKDTPFKLRFSKEEGLYKKKRSMRRSAKTYYGPIEASKARERYKKIYNTRVTLVEVGRLRPKDLGEI